MAPTIDIIDPYLVTWDGDNDPENPLNYTIKQKLVLMVMVAGIAFLTYTLVFRRLDLCRPTGSAMFSPAIPNVMHTFQTTSSLSWIVLRINVHPRLRHRPTVRTPPDNATNACRFLAPLSELYGRTPVIHAGNIVFTVFQIGCAEANSMTTLIILRLFAGIGGSSILSVGGGVIADTFRKEQMGAATAAFSLESIVRAPLSVLLCITLAPLRLKMRLMAVVDLAAYWMEMGNFLRCGGNKVVFLVIGYIWWRLNYSFGILYSGDESGCVIATTGS